jgi:DNA-binding transcriptional LysR family regulator
MDLDPRVLRYFLAVAEDLNFNRAAERLRVSQPSLSLAIKKLEMEHGVRLFHRNSRHVELTDEGKRFVVEAHAVLDALESAAAYLRGLSISGPAVFRVGYSPFLDMRQVASVRSALNNSCSDSRIEFVSVSSARQPTQLAEGTLDAGLLILPIDDRRCSVTVLNREPFFVGMHRRHRLARLRAPALPEFRDEPVIWFPRNLNSRYYDRFLTLCADAGYTPKIVQEVTTIPECLQFIQDGIGITFAPRSFQSVSYDGVIFRELVDERFCVETAVAHRAGDRTELLRRFIDVAGKIFRDATKNARNNGGGAIKPRDDEL